MKHFFVACTLFSLLFSFAQEDRKKQQEEIIEKYLTNCAAKYNYKIQMSERQACLDEGLKIDSTIAYLWQQKAMPISKLGNTKWE